MPPHEKNINDDEEAGEVATDFVPSKGLTSAEAEKKLKEWGRNELMDKKTPKVRK